MSLPELRRNQIHLFFLWEDKVPAALWPQYEGWLSEVERQRARRFHFERDRRQFILGKALTRYVLGAYTGRRPRQIVFTYNDYGKPFIDPGFDISFNLSHSHGINVLTVGRNAMLGVDIERSQRGRADLQIARRYFAYGEYVYLADLPAAELSQEFFSLWTLKEAFIKAQGQGLSFPLCDFSFDLQPPSVSLFLSPNRQIVGHWHAELLRVTQDDLCAWYWQSQKDSTVIAHYHLLVPGHDCESQKVIRLARGQGQKWTGVGVVDPETDT